MEAKPIVIVYFNSNMFGDKSVTDMTKQMNEFAEKKFADYHALAVPVFIIDQEHESIYVKTFYAKDITEIDIESLRKEIMGKFK